MKKRHIIFYSVFRRLVIIFAKIMFGYTYAIPSELPDNYMVLSNHATDYDMLFVGASFKKQMYFVSSEHITRWKLLYKFLKFGFDPIIRYKGASPASTVIEMLRKLKRGYNVCIFPEGVRTWDGVTNEISPATAKVIKTAGCGMVTYKIIGGYLASPMWGGASIRRGKVSGAPVNVYTKEQIANMTEEEIYTAIKNDLYEDAYKRQQESPSKYRSKKSAERIENLIFICPKCLKKDVLRSQGDTVTCQFCGLSFKYDEFGKLNGIREETLKELSDWQKKQVIDDVSNGISYIADNAVLSVIENHNAHIITEGAVELSKDVLKCGETEFAVDNIIDLSMFGRRALVFTANKKYYQLVPSENTSCYKFLLYYKAIKAKTE